MRRLFIQAVAFRKRIQDFDKSGNLLLVIEGELLRSPKAGDVFPGLGGIRKIRVASINENRGKSGSYRVLYLDLPDREHTHLLYIYKKGEAEDISPEGKKVMKSLVKQIKESDYGKE